MNFNEYDEIKNTEFYFSYNDIVKAYSECENNKDKFKDNLHEIYNKDNNSEEFEKAYHAAESTLQREGIYMKFNDSNPYLLLMDVRKDNFVKASYNNNFLLNSSENDYDYYIKYYPVIEFMDGSEEYILVNDIALVDKNGVEEAFTLETFTEGIRGRLKADYFIPVKEEDIPVKIKEVDLLESFIEPEMDVIRAYEDNERGYSFDDLYELEVSNIEDIVNKAGEVKNNLNIYLGADIEIQKDRVIISDKESNDTIKINSHYDYDKVNNELYGIIKFSDIKDFKSLKKEISESILDTSLINKEYSEVSEFELNGMG